MAPENDLLAPPKQLHLLRILGKEKKGGVLTNETRYDKDTFGASFSFITICSRFRLFLTLNRCTISEMSLLTVIELKLKDSLGTYNFSVPIFFQIFFLEMYA